MKKLVFTIYMTLMFALMASAQDPKHTYHPKNHSLSVRETAKISHKANRADRIKRMAKADGVITGREIRTIRHSKRDLRRSVVKEARDCNRF